MHFEVKRTPESCPGFHSCDWLCEGETQAASRYESRASFHLASRSGNAIVRNTRNERFAIWHKLRSDKIRTLPRPFVKNSKGERHGRPAEFEGGKREVSTRLIRLVGAIRGSPAEMRVESRKSRSSRTERASGGTRGTRGMRTATASVVDTVKGRHRRLKEAIASFLAFFSRRHGGETITRKHGRAFHGVLAGYHPGPLTPSAGERTRGPLAVNEWNTWVARPSDTLHHYWLRTVAVTTVAAGAVARPRIVVFADVKVLARNLARNARRRSTRTMRAK